MSAELLPTQSDHPAPSTVRWMLAHWRPYSGTLPVLLALTLVNALLAVMYPWLLKEIINGIEESLSYPLIGRYVALLAAVGAVHFVTYLTMQTLRTRLNLSFEYGVRLRAFENLLRMGPGFFFRFRSGDLVTRLMDDVNEKLSWFMCSGILRVFEASGVIVFGITMMLILNPTLTLYAAGPLPVLVVLFVISAGKLHQRYEAVQKSISQLNDSLETCFSGIRVVKAFGAEESQRRGVEQAVDVQRQMEVRAVRWQTIIDSLYGNIWQLGIVGVLLAGGGMAIAGDVSLGEIVAFDSYVLILVYPMFDIGQFLVRGKLSAVSVGRLDELENAEPEVVLENDRPAAPRRPQDAPPEDYAQAAAETKLPVRLEQVTYRFPAAEAAALEAVDFEARPGQLTAVVGAVGAGKSTLLTLLPRLIDPQAGRVLLGETDVRLWDPVALRQAVGYVPQDVHLLSGTVAENIGFGRAWVGEEDLQAALEVAHLRADLAEWPQGLETVVGSRGIRLSGGQKQRVALARALAGRPGVLLLDDCTASLDAETEDGVWRQLLASAPGCTVLLVTHRPATLRRAEHIVVLHRGRVCESGKFAELNRPGTHFHGLYVRWKLEDEVGGR